LNWKLTLFSLVPIPLVFLSLQVYAKYVRPAFRNRQKVLGDLNALLNDNLSGIREIKAFTREAEEARRVHAGIENYRKSQLSALKLMATFQPFVEFTSSLGHWSSSTSADGCFAGNPVGGKPGGILPVLQSLYAPVQNLSAAWEAIQSSLAGADRVADLIAEPMSRRTVTGRSL